MLKTLSELNRKKFPPPLILLCIILTVVSSSYVAVAQQRGTRGGQQGRTTREPRSRQGGRGQQAQEAQDERREQALENAAGAIDTGLADMLNLVNQQRRPNKNKLASTQQTVQKSRRYLKQLQDNMVCQFLMLSAWTDYFDAGAEKALPPATQAYRRDQANNDAHATQAAIAVLAGKKPLVIRAEIQTQAREPATSRTGAGRSRRGDTTGRQTRGRSRGQDMPSGRGRGRMGPEAGYGGAAAGSYSGAVSSGNILDLDTDSIKADWLGRKVGQFSLNCLNGTFFAYNPAEANLCVLFWKLAAADLADYAGSADGEPNEPAEMQRTATTRQRPSYPSQPGRMDRMAPRDRFSGRMSPGRRQGFYGDEEAAPSDPVSMQISALGNLFNSKFQDPDVKFIAVNTNNPRTAPAVVAKLLQSPWPWAQAMLDEKTATSAFSDLDITKVTSAQPVLAVVDRTGTVRYAGPAAGFLAPMVVDELLGGSITSQDPEQPQPVAGDRSRADEQVPLPKTAAPAEPYQQKTHTEPTTTEYIPAQVQQDRDTEITPEDFQAQKLLAYAQGLFIPAGRKKFLTSKMGVDLCRRIIREYPNTTYADEARKLLRTVPPNEQKRYNITPEEMGL